jgi:hypothetical protein
MQLTSRTRCQRFGNLNCISPTRLDPAATSAVQNRHPMTSHECFIRLLVTTGDAFSCAQGPQTPRGYPLSLDTVQRRPLGPDIIVLHPVMQESSTTIRRSVAFQPSWQEGTNAGTIGGCDGGRMTWQCLLLLALRPLDRASEAARQRDLCPGEQKIRRLCGAP